VREGGDGLGLALDARQRLGAAGSELGQDLDGDLAPEPRVACPVHLSHPACPERRKDFVEAEARAGEKTHGLLRRADPLRLLAVNVEPVCRRT